MKIYNTFTRKKEEFIPLVKNHVKLYVCGPTVYDDLHIGNFRGAIFFNMVRNWFEKKGYQVEYVYNYTDVDDKIIQRANEKQCSPLDISKKYISSFEEDYKSLSLKPHTQNPKVSDCIDPIIKFIKDLESKGAAYESQGSVYFDVSYYDRYGQLSGRSLESMQSGHRVESSADKKNDADFVLWKKSKPDEISWSSPWGEGRPGWHIECSSMCASFLGTSIDIHGGGIDLLFPHHENERAQSEALHEKPFVGFWMHHNMIQVDDEKMSKSIGNIIKAKEFIRTYSAEVLKWMMLFPHYQSEINFSDVTIGNSIRELGRVYSCLDWAQSVQDKSNDSHLGAAFSDFLKEKEKEIALALDDNFNTPVAFSHLLQIVKEINRNYRKPAPSKEGKVVAFIFSEWIRDYVGSIFELFKENPHQYLTQLDNLLLDHKGLEREAIDTLVEKRIELRKQKKYEQADELRDELLNLGIEIQDISPEKTKWEVKK